MTNRTAPVAPAVPAAEPQGAPQDAPQDAPHPVLRVEDLRVELETKHGPAPVIDNLSFMVREGETLGFIGESGCGKSMTALAIMGLLPEPIGRFAAGRIFFQGEDLLKMDETRLRAIRGNEISMIFQEPMTSLNPLYPIGDQIAEGLRLHQGLSAKMAWARAIEWLDAVHIPNARARAQDYPHQLSGGQRQRVMIAMALACAPKLLVADEPTTALDVTVQAQIFELLKELAQETATAVLFITHDMAALAQMAHRMIVMYGGRKVEEGPVDLVLARPRHPYTKGLMAAMPSLGETVGEERPELAEIAGIVPPLREFGQEKCMFEPRCFMARKECADTRPHDIAFRQGAHQGAHLSACLFAREV